MKPAARVPGSPSCPSRHHTIPCVGQDRPGGLCRLSPGSGCRVATKPPRQSQQTGITGTGPRRIYPARRVEESGVIYEMALEDETFIMRVLDPETEAVTQSYDLVGVIAYTPLRQYLAMTPGNKLQTISASYDVLKDEWFDVYQEQDRLPGEWPWSRHELELQLRLLPYHRDSKGYDFETNSYHSRWVQQGVACAECHGNLGLRRGPSRPPRPPSWNGFPSRRPCRTARPATRAAINSRRLQSRRRLFRPLQLALPSQPGLYHHDGQILDEVFVYGSFQMSRMHHAGVQCMDCRNPIVWRTYCPSKTTCCMKCRESGADHPHHQADRTQLPRRRQQRQSLRGMPHAKNHVYGSRPARRPASLPDPLMTRARHSQRM